MPSYPTLRNGNRGAVTPAQLARAKMRVYSQEYAEAGLRKQVYTRVTADYVADGSLWKIEMTHNINSPHYTWSVVKTENSAGIIPEFIHQGDLVLTLWFLDNSKTLAITIIG